MGKKAKSKAIAVPRAQEEQNAAVNAASGQSSTNDVESLGSEGNASHVARVPVIVPVLVEAGESSNVGNAKQADLTETGESGNAFRAKQTDDPTEAGEPGNAGNAKQTGDPAEAESKETKDEGGAGKAPPEFRYIPHKEFKTLVDGNVSKFPHADKIVEVGSTYYYRKYMDTYIHWAIGVAYEVIGHVRLILTLQIFKQAVAKHRYNFLPKQYVSVFIDMKVWDYFFGKHPAEKLVERPAFPFAIPEKDFTLEHCKAFSIWRMAIGLSVNQVEPFGDQILQATGEVLKEGPVRMLMDKYTRPDFQAMLDEAGHTSFYESVPLPDSESGSGAGKKGSSVTKSSSDPKDSSGIEGKGKLVPGMSANLGTGSNSTTRDLSRSSPVSDHHDTSLGRTSVSDNTVKGESSTLEASPIGAYVGTPLRSPLGSDFGRWRMPDFDDEPIHKSLLSCWEEWSELRYWVKSPLVVAPFEIKLPHARITNQILQTGHIVTTRHSGLFNLERRGLRDDDLRLGINVSQFFHGNLDEDQKEVLRDTWRCIVRWTTVVYLGVTIEFSKWCFLWSKNLYSPMKNTASEQTIYKELEIAERKGRGLSNQYGTTNKDMMNFATFLSQEGACQLSKQFSEKISGMINQHSKSDDNEGLLKAISMQVLAQSRTPIQWELPDRLLHFGMIAVYSIATSELETASFSESHRLFNLIRYQE